MNCFFHTANPATSVCCDCGKGLCSKCSKLYSITICTSCNSRRVIYDRSQIINELFITFGISLLFAIPSSVIIIMQGPVNFVTIISQIIAFFLLVYSVGSLITGWKVTNKLSLHYLLEIPLVGIFLFFILKLILSIITGVVMFPIRMVKNIKELKRLNKISEYNKSLLKSRSY